MQLKFKEIKEAYGNHSSKTGEITRQLALAGVAIIWIFKSDNLGADEYAVSLPQTSLWALIFFISSLGFDLLHAFIPSLIYGIMTEIEDKKGTNEETYIDFRFWWAIPSWVLYILKVLTMIVGYAELFSYVTGELIN